MPDNPTVADLAAHAAKILAGQQKLREAMQQVAAEHASPVPLAPEPPAAS